MYNVGVIVLDVLKLAFLLLLISLPILYGLCFYIEYRSYNKGYCLNCYEKLRYFDNDSQGNRAHICDKCGYITWVSLYIIDKLR